MFSLRHLSESVRFAQLFNIRRDGEYLEIEFINISQGVFISEEAGNKPWIEMMNHEQLDVDTASTLCSVLYVLLFSSRNVTISYDIQLLWRET